MKKLRCILAVLAMTFVNITAAFAADVSYTSVLSGSVVSVSSAGAPVKAGDVLMMVQSLAGPMPAVRADADGTVKTVLVQPGTQVQQGAVVLIVEEK